MYYGRDSDLSQPFLFQLHNKLWERTPPLKYRFLLVLGVVHFVRIKEDRKTFKVNTTFFHNMEFRME